MGEEAEVLDVHPPHEAVHGWRDFLLHILTIVIGLLIAIGLEQTVEWAHHREIVRVARENIRREIVQNREASVQDQGYLQSDADRMKGNAGLARAFLTNKKAFEHASMSFTFTWNGFTDSAWRSARDSGALVYMPMEEVQRYDDLYRQQDIVDEQAVAIFTRQPEIAAALMFIDAPGGVSVEEARALMTNCEVTYYRLLTLKELVIELHTMEEEASRK